MRKAQRLIDFRKAFPSISESEANDWMDIAVMAMEEQNKEIATLRSRIDTAQVAIMDTRDVLGLCAPTEDAFPALYALQGHRVAIIDLGAAK